MNESLNIYIGSPLSLHTNQENLKNIIIEAEDSDSKEENIQDSIFKYNTKKNNYYYNIFIDKNDDQIMKYYLYNDKRFNGPVKNIYLKSLPNLIILSTEEKKINIVKIIP